MTPHIIISAADLSDERRSVRVTRLFSIMGQIAWFGAGVAVGLNWDALVLAAGRVL